MNEDATILTDHMSIAAALRKSVPNTVLEVDNLFIDLSDSSYTADFEPKFRQRAPKFEKTIANLRGKVICALPPGCLKNMLLYCVAHTLRDRPDAQVLYAPLHSLRPDDIKTAIAQAERPDPHFVTSLIAWRLTERIIGNKLGPAFREQNIEYSRWSLYFYLLLIHRLTDRSWTRTLHWGTGKPHATADEIDKFGGIRFFGAEPKGLCGQFRIGPTRDGKGPGIFKEADYPDPRLRLNQLLATQFATGRPLDKGLLECREELEKAYYEGRSTWPFVYGGVSFGENPYEIFEASTKLKKLRPPIRALKTIRLFENGRDLFRSISYRALDNSFPPINDFAESIPQQEVRITVDVHPPNTALASVIKRLNGWQLNLDLSAVLKGISMNFIERDADTLKLTATGLKVVDILLRMELRLETFYSIFRKLEDIQDDEERYENVMTEIAEIFQA